VTTPDTESSQATDIGSLERDDEKGAVIESDLVNNQLRATAEEEDVNEEEELPPPPVAARPERTKSIVRNVLRKCYQNLKNHRFYLQNTKHFKKSQ